MAWPLPRRCHSRDRLDVWNKPSQAQPDGGGAWCGLSADEESCPCAPPLHTTGQNVRKLIKNGLVIRKPQIIHSRARARLAAEAKAKGRHTGYGERLQQWQGNGNGSTAAAVRQC